MSDEMRQEQPTEEQQEESALQDLNLPEEEQEGVKGGITSTLNAALDRAEEARTGGGG